MADLSLRSRDVMAEVEEMLGTRVSYVGVGPTLASTLEIPIAAHLGISNMAVIRGRDGQERSGFRYSVGGKDQKLKLGDELRIPPFEVAVIEILETVNMPRFLIGRWNIRVAWAYEGLIWVGGPQVDAGFRGILLCPIWNLSNKDFFIKSGEPIAVIDFQTTTPPTEGSKPYEWRERSRIVFQDYDKPRSGLVTDLIERIEDIKKESEQNRSRIDFFIATTFGALGILVAALAFIATRSPDNVHPHWWDPALYWLYSITTFLALMAWMKSRSKGRWWRAIKLFVLLVAAGAVCLQAFFSWQQVRRGSDVQGQIQQLKTRIDSLEHPQDC